MERIVKAYSERSKRNMQNKVKQITEKQKADEKFRRDNEYLKVKNGEMCGMCLKETELCTCGVNDDWREDEKPRQDDGN